MNLNVLSCTDCKHIGRMPHHRRVGVHLCECRHDKVRGLMACEACRRWSLYELFVAEPIETGVKIRCPRDCCRHLQTIPDDTDWRVAYLGDCTDCESMPVPQWCPGFELRPAPKPKQKKESQLDLFG